MVRDDTGLDCAAAELAFAAMRPLSVSVWVTHEESGSYKAVENGCSTREANAIDGRYRRGEELVITAEGPDAERALRMVRALLEAPPEKRRSLYRRLRKESR